MDLKEFSFRRFRAFDTETRLRLAPLTVLTGPNNLGKSTILRAIGVFFGSLQTRRIPLRRRPHSRLRYRYEDDYPKKYDGRRGRRWSTRMIGTMAFDDDDQESAERSLGFSIPSTLSITVEYPHGEDIPRREKLETNVDGWKEEQHAEFLRWFGAQYRYVYIPAIRGIDDFRHSVFDELVTRAIQKVRRSKQRLKALDNFFADIQEEIAGVEEELGEVLRAFIPDVKSIDFELSELNILRLVSVRDIHIDDAARTSLELKGDGFKSLFAMSILQYLARQQHGRDVIFGIEEPEAHLHSNAIYTVKDTLRELAKDFQVLITTHSPILIERTDIGSNLIVEQEGTEDFRANARTARTLGDIRASLGIRPQDNMMTAEVVLVVEGTSEEVSMAKVLEHVLPGLNAPLAEGRIRVVAAGGASKISSVIRALARDAASAVLLVDSDAEGREVAQRMRDSGLLAPADVFEIPARKGCKETEFEDAFPVALYVDRLNEACGLAVTSADVEEARRRSGGRHSRYAKWSTVMEALFVDNGKNWDGLKETAKTAVASALRDNAHELQVDQFPWVLSLARRIQRHLEQG